MRFSGAFAAGTVSVVDLRANPQCEFTGPFEALQFYVPRQVLEDFFREHNGGSVRTLHWPRDQLDETLVGLSRVLLSVARQPAAANRLFVDQLGLSVLAHVAQSYGGLDAQRARMGAGLAPWQQRRATEMMHARIGGQVTIKEIARECQLSPSHFARAFRFSFGTAPHRYLSDLRIAEAKRLMSTTDLSLAEIALRCGFTEQSHFARSFRRQVGDSPGAWRGSVKG
ncbi:helix-turn-helix transcriptional regulator [Ancylobacter sp.]|uniref:helix-turn-helix transcriptional regulator n=1 Tax=Ancylobacter sp. TaxID=1872567 RepID=UPI003D09BD6E